MLLGVGLRVEHQRSGGLRAGAQSDRLHDQECRHTASDRHREART